MGEIASSIINGEFDCVTGEYLGEPTGYPRTYEPNHPNTVKKPKLLANQKNCKELNGIAKFLMMNGVDHDHEAIHLIRNYCKKHLNFEGTLKECAIEIQKTFSHFSRHIRRLYGKQ